MAMTIGKTHALLRATKSGVRYAVCGWFAGPVERYTRDEDAVTCRLCIERIDVRPADVVDEHYESGGWKPAIIGCRTPAVLREDVERAEWFSWRTARRRLVRWRDEGPTLKSGSRPERFEAHAQGSTSEHAQGDAAQRDAERYAWLAKWFDEALAASTIDIALETRREVLDAAIVGRWVLRQPVSPTGEVRKKSCYTTRLQEATPDIALRFGVRGDDVMRIVRDVGIYMEERLLSDGRGLVLHADETLRKSEMGIKDYDLEGWEAIAYHLEVDRSTAIRWRNQGIDGTGPRMPVYDGHGLTVRAKRRELDEYSEKRMRDEKRRRKTA